MDVVIIGSGNVAHCFSHLLKMNGHQIQQVISKTPEHARELAEKLNTDHTADLAEINYDADAYLLAVSDDAIREVAGNLRLGKRLIAHTAGAVGMEVLAQVSSSIGVLYPLQTLRKEDFDRKKIPLLVEGNSPSAVNRLTALGTAISENIIPMDSNQRLKMHLAAIFCNNFPNHLATLCKSYCAKEGLEFNLLLPLLEETFGQMTKPLEAVTQTGPARRGDQLTLQKHESLLTNYPAIKSLYELLSESIQKYYQS